MLDQPEGSMTVSMTWMTPFDCITLGIVTWATSPLASVTVSPRPALADGQGLALDGLELGLAAACLDLRHEVGRGQLARNDVVGQDAR